MNRLDMLARWGNVALACLMAVLALACAARAAVSITTANASVVTFNLVSGAVSAAISPTADSGVLVIPVCTTSSTEGVAYVTVERGSAANMTWVGRNSGGSAVFGSSSTTGVTVATFSSAVALEVSGPDKLRVHNTAGGDRACKVTMIW